MNAIDQAAIAAAHALVARTPQAKFLGNILNGAVGAIDGADSQQSGAEQQYSNAADSSNKAYSGAVTNTDAAYAKALQALLTGANGGSAQTFAADTAAGLQPGFDIQDNNLAAREASMGILNSGGAKADFSQLTADQGATLAGDVAPLYANEQASYDNLLSGNAAADAGLYGSKASAASGDYSTGAGAGVNAYNNANQQFYAALAAAAGAPGATPASTNDPTGYGPGTEVAPADGSIPGEYTGGVYGGGYTGTPNPYTSSDGYIYAGGDPSSGTRG